MMKRKYRGKSEEELLMMGYAAYSIWLIVFPQIFGLDPIPDDEMIHAADRSSRELRNIFHAEPIKPWKARKGRRIADIHRFSRREEISMDQIIKTA